MWGVAKSLLVILSVAINSAFVAAWVTQAFPEKKCSKSSDCELFRKIGVTEAQLDMMLVANPRRIFGRQGAY